MSTKTKQQVFGIVGDPVAHSLSPVMHNAAFAELGLNAEYKVFPVKAAELSKFFARLRSGEITGVNVTVPHKEAALTLCDEVSEEASRIDAVNTVVLRDSKLFGDNTDARGFVSSLAVAYRLNLYQLNIVVIGAGGAGLAVCHGLSSAGAATITIVNRNLERARSLAACLQMRNPEKFIQSLPFQEIAMACEDADLIVNTTSLGMTGQDWPDLSFLNTVQKNAIVSDIVYRPRETALIKAAHGLGLRTHCGDGMLLHQGMLAFELFTGKKAPLDVMEKALFAALV